MFHETLGLLKIGTLGVYRTVQVRLRLRVKLLLDGLVVCTHGKSRGTGNGNGKPFHVRLQETAAGVPGGFVACNIRGPLWSVGVRRPGRYFDRKARTLAGTGTARRDAPTQLLVGDCCAVQSKAMAVRLRGKSELPDASQQVRCNPNSAILDDDFKQAVRQM